MVQTREWMCLLLQQAAGVLPGCATGRPLARMCWQTRSLAVPAQVPAVAAGLPRLPAAGGLGPYTLRSKARSKPGLACSVQQAAPLRRILLAAEPATHGDRVLSMQATCRCGQRTASPASGKLDPMRSPVHTQHGD